MTYFYLNIILGSLSILSNENINFLVLKYNGTVGVITQILLPSLFFVICLIYKNLILPK